MIACCGAGVRNWHVSDLPMRAGQCQFAVIRLAEHMQGSPFFRTIQVSPKDVPGGSGPYSP
jgi:hypothetical protein